MSLASRDQVSPTWRPTKKWSQAGSTAHVAGLLLVWYISSVITSITTKEILRIFPFPITVATVQQFVAAVGGFILAHAQLQDAGDAMHSWRVHTHSFAPVSLVMVFALVSYRWSLMSVSISFTHTVKTLGPIFTIIFARMLLGERITLARCCAVIPVVIGVAITTVTEVEFAWVGFFAAILSTVAQALQTALSKKVLREQAVTKAQLFCVAAIYAFLMLLPPFVLLDAWRIFAGKLLHKGNRLDAGKWLCVNGLCSFVNQYAGLSVLDALASPLSHALANVMKRAAVISAAMLYAARPVTPTHAFGIALSVFGTLIYQRLQQLSSGRDARFPLRDHAAGNGNYEALTNSESHVELTALPDSPTPDDEGNPPERDSIV